MENLKPTWKIAAQVSLLHTRISNQITFCLLILALIISAIVLKLTGHTLSFELFLVYFIQYRWIIIPVLLIIHFIPVNLYAVTRVLQHPYFRFRILLVPVEDNHEANHRSDKTL